jgi:hypothetical protein
MIAPFEAGLAFNEQIHREYSLRLIRLEPHLYHFSVPKIKSPGDEFSRWIYARLGSEILLARSVACSSIKE